VDTIGWQPGWVLDSCSEVSSNRVEGMIDLRSIKRTGRSTDASYKEP